MRIFRPVSRSTTVIRSPDWLYGTFNLSESLSKETFRVEASAAEGEVAVVAAMEMYDGYFKRAFEAELPVVDGNVLCDPLNDVAKISVIDRHHGVILALQALYADSVWNAARSPHRPTARIKT